MKKILIRVGIVMLIIFAVISGLIYYFNFSISRFKGGDLVVTSNSPDNEYTVNLYHDSRGMVGSDTVRGELVYESKITGWTKKKNIYWKYRETETDIRWRDNTTVVINGIPLDVRHDIYDCRRDPEFKRIEDKRLNEFFGDQG